MHCLSIYCQNRKEAIPMRIIIVLSVFLIGCVSSIVLFDDYYIDNNVGRCFKLKKESFVYEATCTDIEKLSTERKDCLGIQSFGIRGGSKTLNSYSQYQQEEEYWLEHIQDINKTIFENKRRILYGVPAGSELKITRIARVRKAMHLPEWSISAKVNEIELALPTERYHMGPRWIPFNRVESEDIEFVEEFLEKTACEQ